MEDGGEERRLGKMERMEGQTDGWKDIRMEGRNDGERLEGGCR